MGPWIYIFTSVSGDLKQTDQTSETLLDTEPIKNGKRLCHKYPLFLMHKGYVVRQHLAFLLARAVYFKVANKCSILEEKINCLRVNLCSENSLSGLSLVP